MVPGPLNWYARPETTLTKAPVETLTSVTESPLRGLFPTNRSRPTTAMGEPPSDIALGMNLYAGLESTLTKAPVEASSSVTEAPPPFPTNSLSPAAAMDSGALNWYAERESTLTSAAVGGGSGE